MLVRMTDKKLFSASSLLDFLSCLLVRLVAIVALFYLLAHFNENPSLIAILAFVCVLLVAFIGEEHLSVYPDRVVQQSNSIASFVYKGKGNVYKIADIKSASLRPPPPPTAEEVGVALLLTAVLPKQKNNRDTLIPIFLELKDGQMVQLNTGVDQKKVQELVKLINSLVKK